MRVAFQEDDDIDASLENWYRGSTHTVGRTTQRRLNGAGLEFMGWERVESTGNHSVVSLLRVCIPNAFVFT